MKGPESGATATTKMEFFDQVTLCLGILEMQTNAIVAEERAFMESSYFENGIVVSVT